MGIFYNSNEMKGLGISFLDIDFWQLWKRDCVFHSDIDI